ncbi:MAG: cyclic nucleotide-binding domain-containing protein [Thermodesulfobacteriota bacterium]|nr:cyclic nucleotide-binding domain-containing protein [Thermodesulfobacteriota bacterium]
MEKDISILKETTLFKDLTAEHIRKILSISKKVLFSENDVIIKEGEVGDTMHIMLEGTVEVAKSLIIGGMDDEITGKDKVFTKLSPGQHAVFGEISLLEECERTATVRAVTDCVLYEIKKDDFLRLAGEDCELGYRVLLNLAGIVSSRLRKADEDTVKLTTVLSIVLKEL